MSENPRESAMPLEYARPVPNTKRTRVRIIIALVLVGAVGALFASVLSLTALNTPRVQSNRVMCASNMRQICQAIAIYANDHHGAFPNDLGTILANEDVTSAVFTCPSTGDTPAVVPTTQAALTAFAQPGHCSYVYLGKGLTDQTSTPDVVLLYEPLSNHGGGGMNVLYGDQHVEWVSAQQAQPILKQIASGVRPVRDPSQISTTAPATH